MVQNPLIVGVMGGGNVDNETAQYAYQLGGLIAARGWVLLKLMACINHRIRWFAAKPGRFSNLLDG